MFFTVFQRDAELERAGGRSASPEGPPRARAHARYAFVPLACACHDAAASAHLAHAAEEAEEAT